MREQRRTTHAAHTSVFGETRLSRRHFHGTITHMRVTPALALLLLATATAPARAQVDLTEVFVPPSESELLAVRAEWAARFPTAANWAVVASATNAQGQLIQIVRHDIQPQGVHYAAIRYPASFSPQSQYPVVLCLHGGIDGVSTSIFGMYDSMAGTGIDACSGRPAILVAPSYRCEPVIAGQLGTFLSTGDCMLGDYEVDDVIGLVSGVLANIPAADENHVFAWGFSHGGGVLLGVLARDHRVRGGIDFYGPADVFQSSSQAEAEALVNSGACDQPGGWRLMVCDYAAGTATLEETRLELLRHSRGHFVDQIARLDVHHGTIDPTVDVIQSRLLTEHAAQVSPPMATFHYFEYPNGVHAIQSLDGHVPRVRAFLCAAFDMPPARPADIDQNGQVGAADLAYLLSAWGTVSATNRADVDGSHTIDGADLALLLGNWG